MDRGERLVYTVCQEDGSLYGDAISREEIGGCVRIAGHPTQYNLLSRAKVSNDAITRR